MTSVITNIILILVLTGMVGGAVRYIYKEKKKGTKCIGCPYGGSCSGNCQNTHN